MQEQNDLSIELHYYLLMIHEDRDTALLSLLKSFMESAPQLILQVYILAKWKHFNNAHTSKLCEEKY